MNRCAKPFLCLVLSVLSLFAAFPATARADESNKTILSRTAENDGVKLHYLTASLSLISDSLPTNQRHPDSSRSSGASLQWAVRIGFPNVCQKPWVPTSPLFKTWIIPTKGLCIGPQAPNLSAARAFAFAASSSRFLGGALVSSKRRRRFEMPATSSTAARNEASFAFDGLLNPLIFLTN